MSKQKHIRTIFKKLDSSGHYRFYSRTTRKRISSKKYYSRIKFYQTVESRKNHPRAQSKKRKIVQQPRKTLSKSKKRNLAVQSKIKTVKVSSLFAHGFNYVREVDILFGDNAPDEIVEIILEFLADVFKSKKLLEAMYVEISGILISDLESDFFRRTPMVYSKEFKKLKSFQQEVILSMVKKIYDLFGMEFYDRGEVDDFEMLKISLNTRK